MEKVFRLNGINPVEFYGINNEKLNVLQKLFPKLKIIARGDEIKVLGEESELSFFEEKMLQLFNHFNSFNAISISNIRQIIKEGKTEVHGKTPEVILYGSGGKAIKAITPNQKLLVKLSQKNDLSFAIGPAGTGKTYTATALAVKALKNREVKRIILSRPAVEAGENLGFLPGDLKEKIDPYLQPLYDALLDMIPPRKLADYLETDVIQIAPLAYMRGRTLNDAFVILDEAQNTTINQLKMFLTRMGVNAKFIVTGDITQIDLPIKQNSGLLEAIKLLKKIKGIAFIYFDEEDIMRHRLVKDIVKAYEKKKL